MTDKSIICKDCGKEFIFAVGEQKFYESKGLAAPVRCKECRQKRKADKEVVPEKTPEQKAVDFEAMLERFKRDTIKFEEEVNKKRKSRG